MFSKKVLALSLPAFFVFFTPCLPTAFTEELSQCALCHVDSARIDELTEDIIIYGDDKNEISLKQSGKGYIVKQAPFDLYEKILVDESFFSSPHGQIPCNMCHLGKPDSNDPETAHEGMLRDPSFNSDTTCGQCHDEITSNTVASLHMNPAPLYSVFEKRCSKEQFNTLTETAILEQQCLTCHQGSCGSCHVSRPDIVGGGLRKGHLFQKQTEFVYGCLPCHTHPTGTDFIGRQGKGDIHYRKYNMTCSDCHSGQEMHASAVGVKDRYHFENRPSCISCHDNNSNSEIPEHVLHETVSCSVCHAAAYENCYACHIGTDNEGLIYSQSPPPVKNFKIGLNPDKTGSKYVLVREVGIHRNTFSDSIGNMQNFAALPTHKRASPHTIQRRTWQTADCNHCHGNKELFLTQDSVPFDDIVANGRLVLKPSDVPKKVQAKRSFLLSPIHPDTAMRVSAKWLKKHKRDKNLIILDTRTKKEYEASHIPGAFHLCFCLFRTGGDTTPPYMMLAPELLAKVFGGSRLGLTPEKRIVIYDDGHSGRGIAFLALKMIGHKKISFLDGTVHSWEKQSYKLATGKAPAAKTRAYPLVKSPDYLITNHEIIEKMGSGRAIVVDARNVAQHNGDLTRTDIASHGGSIPESVSFPLRTLHNSDGSLYSDKRLSWLLSSSGISASGSKEILITCNTNMLAAELYMILTYLGYDNVKVHDGSWAEWAAEFIE